MANIPDEGLAGRCPLCNAAVCTCGTPLTMEQLPVQLVSRLHAEFVLMDAGADMKRLAFLRLNHAAIEPHTTH